MHLWSAMLASVIPFAMETRFALWQDIGTLLGLVLPVRNSAVCRFGFRLSNPNGSSAMVFKCPDLVCTSADDCGPGRKNRKCSRCDGHSSLIFFWSFL
jgi:hypothetical protein